MPLGDPLFFDFRQLHLKGVQMADGGGARGHVTFRLLSEFQKIVVIPPVPGFFRPLVGPLTDAEERRPGRQSQGFLRAAEHDVQAPLIERDRQDAEGRNGVHDQKNIGIFGSHEVCDVGQRAQHPRGSFMMNQGQGVKSALG